MNLPSAARRLCLTLLFFNCLLPLSGDAQTTTDDRAPTNATRLVRRQTPSGRPDGAVTGLNRQASANDRSSQLAQAMGRAFRDYNTNEAVRLLGQYTGDINELRTFGGEPLVVTAARQGSLGMLNLLLERKADPNQASPNGNTALMAAIQRTAWPVALRLIEAGANAGLGTPLGELVKTWWTGRPDHELQAQVLQQLLDHGADPFASLGHGQRGSALESALSRNDASLGDLLLTNRPSPARRTPGGDTALHLAAQWGRTNAIDFLLSAGFSINQTNSDGLTPLQSVMVPSPGAGIYPSGIQNSFRISGRGFPTPPSPSTIVDLLLSRGATLDVWSIAELGRTNELSALLRSNPALVNARDGLGRTPLHCATFAAEVSAAKLLIQAGADVSAVTTKPIPGRSGPLASAGSSPLHLASVLHNAELAGMLLRAGSLIGQPDEMGDAPLHLAARNGQTNVLRALVEAHAPLDATNQVGQTALRMAVESGLWANVELLLKTGAKPDIGSGAETLLHVAAAQGSTNVINALLQHGLKLEARDDEGHTPFQRAVAAKRWDAMNLLLAKGADINAADPKGNTALHQLATQNQDSIGHQVELPWLARMKWDWFSHPGIRQSTITNLARWKVISQPAAPAWTNVSLTGWLLEHKANPDLANLAGETPLHLLCGQQWIIFDQQAASNRVATLVNGGANVSAADSQGRTPINLAINHASVGVIAALIKHVGKLDQFRDHSGESLLHLAVTNQQEQRVQIMALLLDNHLDPNVRDREGRTPLHLLAELMRSGRYTYHMAGIMDSLLMAGADASLRDNEGQTFLHRWCEQGRMVSSDLDDKVKQLLAEHPELMRLTNAAGDTPLYLAQKEGLWRVANALRPPGCTVSFYSAIVMGRQNDFDLYLKTEPKLANITFDNGKTALAVALQPGMPKQFAPRLLELGATLDPMSALKLGRVEDARRLMEGGANLSSTNWFEAINLKRFEEVKDLAAAHGDLEALDGEGHTLFYRAASSGQTNTADWLRDRGVKPNFFDAIGLGDTNSMLAFLATNQSLANASYGRNQTVLMFAASTRQGDSARVLIKHGAKIDAQDPQGWTALHTACARGAKEVAEELLRAGASLDARESSGLTPLHLAAAGGSNDVVKLLLDHKADVNQPQTAPANFYQTQTLSAGSAPLHWAALCNRLETVKLLLQSGADINATNTAGETPLDLVGINPSTYQGIPRPLLMGYYSMANKGPKLWTLIETELKQAGGVRKCTVAISTGYGRAHSNLPAIGTLRIP